MKSLVFLLAVLSLAAASAAPVRSETTAVLKVAPWTKPLPFIAGLAFLPDGRALATEKDTGVIRLINRDGSVRAKPFARLKVYGRSEYGLLGIAVDPAFARHPYVYVYYTQPSADNFPRQHRLVRYRFGRGGVGVSPRIILDNVPVAATARQGGAYHAGGALAFLGTNLLVTVGDGQHERTQAGAAQDPRSVQGKVLRITRDGRPAPGNPFGNKVYTRGHRNSFGLTVDRKTKAVFESENGPDQSDEVNRLLRGGNYGWPTCQGMSICNNSQAPLWESGERTLAPSGIISYHGTRVKALKDSVTFCVYNTGELVSLRLNAAQTRVLSSARYRGSWRCASVVVERPGGEVVFYDVLSGRLLRLVG